MKRAFRDPIFVALALFGLLATTALTDGRTTTKKPRPLDGWPNEPS
jgi:hypothetical protein